VNEEAKAHWGAVKPKEREIPRGKCYVIQSVAEEHKGNLKEEGVM
jgi:hypothetical protein